MYGLVRPIYCGRVWIILVKSGGLGSFSRWLCCELGIREHLNAESAIL